VVAGGRTTQTANGTVARTPSDQRIRIPGGETITETQTAALEIQTAKPEKN